MNGLPPQIEGFDLIPTKADVEDERERVTLELGHAILRYRQAWNLARQVGEAYQKPGTPPHIARIKKEGDDRYQQAMADIQFWRQEIQTNSLALMALDHVSVALTPTPRGVAPRSGVHEGTPSTDFTTLYNPAARRRAPQ